MVKLSKALQREPWWLSNQTGDGMEAYPRSID